MILDTETDLGLLHIRQIARQIKDELLEDPLFMQGLRLAVLMVVNEQNRQRETTAVETFLSACRERGIAIRLDEEGKFKIKHGGLENFTAELKAVFMMYRDAIKQRLESERETLKFKTTA